jgi:predicted outer membrane protein
MRFVRRTPVFLCLLALLAGSRALAADAKDSPQAKAYLAMWKAVETGDYEAYKKAHTKETAKQIDQQTKEMKMDPKKTMEFMKDMAPKELKFTGLKVDGKKATLDATGKVGGEANKGTVSMEEEDGQWKVVKESWTNAK